MILLASFGMLALTVWLYGKGEIGFEGILTCTIAMMGSFGPVVAVSSLSNNLNQTLASGERVLSLLEETPMVEEISGNVDIRTDSDNEISNTSIVLENTDNDIRNQNNSPEKEKYILRGILTGRAKNSVNAFSGAEAQHVTFAYENETILDDYFLKLEPGKITGIHGASGSGKSYTPETAHAFLGCKRGKCICRRRRCEKNPNQIFARHGKLRDTGNLPVPRFHCQ